MAVLPRHYMFGIIAFTFIIIGGVAMIGEMRSADPTFGDDDKFEQFNATFNKLDNVQGSIDGLQGGILNASTDFGTFGVLNSLINSGWATLKLMFSSLGFMTGIFNGMTTIFGVPAWIPGLVLLMITTMLIFTIYSAIFQKEI